MADRLIALYRCSPRESVTNVAFLDLGVALQPRAVHDDDAETVVHVMTGGSGSPANSTLMMSIYLWQSAFQYFKMGYASAQAWVLFSIIVTFTVVLFKVSGRLVYYGGR
jgi:hypothetical protein